MPRPTLLPVPDYKDLFNNGQSYNDWLAAAEKAKEAEKMAALGDEISLDDNVRERLSAIRETVHIIAIAESWCGDVIRHVPLLVKMGTCSDKIKLRFIRRDTDLEFFARFLTNGGEAIPKFVFLSRNFVECGNWGPMSSTPRQFISKGKACDDLAKAREKVSDFYKTNKRQESISELLALIETAAFPGFE